MTKLDQRTIGLVVKTLSVCQDDAENICRLMETAKERGRAGRWPDQRFEAALDWDDRPVLDRISVVSDVDRDVLISMYAAAHREGLNLRQPSTPLLPTSR